MSEVLTVVSLVFCLIQQLKIADAKTIGDILFAQGKFSNSHSARVNAQKHLNNLVDLGKIERGDGFYRVGTKSEYGEHARLLTAHLAQILSVKSITTVIYREAEIPIGFRADALVFCQRENMGICFVLEVAHNETHNYLRRKADAWRAWKGAKNYLTQVFNTPIHSYGFVVSGREIGYPFHKLLTKLGGNNG